MIQTLNERRGAAIRRLSYLSSVSALAIIALTVAGGSVQAYFKDIGMGARPLGMGGAYVAAADDANAVLWNAAGLAQLRRQEVTAMFAALYTGLGAKLYSEETDRLGYHFVSYVFPSDIGSFGISWGTFQSHVYDESTLCLSYGRRLNKHSYGGVNSKRMGWSVQGNEYTRLDRDIPDQGASRKEFSFDLSALCKVTERFSAGFSAENLLLVDVGLNTKENIPVNLRAGVSYRLDNLWNSGARFLPVLDITYREWDGTSVRMGLEGWFLNERLAARAGWNSTSATLGFSYRLTRGAVEMQIDYAFVYPTLIRQTYGSHRTSISMRL